MMKIAVEHFEERLMIPLFKLENGKLEVLEAFISVITVKVDLSEKKARKIVQMDSKLAIANEAFPFEEN